MGMACVAGLGAWWMGVDCKGVQRGSGRRLRTVVAGCLIHLSMKVDAWCGMRWPHTCRACVHVHARGMPPAP
jgi:hypothetical protein